jgi:iron complex outermembrane receptor protein
MDIECKTRSAPPSLVGRAVAAILAGVPLVVGLGMAGFASTAQAQEAEGAGELEEVTVTGSRIVRRDLVSSSPLVSVSSEAFEQQSGLNVESYLNQMPNFNPAAAPTVQTGPGGNSDVQISAVNSVGISTLSLRGFGANRNLVLVNGKRPTPINALMVTDINAIPSALIERVEIITGGASAVYGADAIGGVTNFILKENFQGLEVDLQQGITEAGDGEQTRVYAIMGTDVAEGRGNVTMGAEWYDRQGALEAEREFFTNAWADPTVGSDFFVFGYNGYNTAQTIIDRDAANAIFAGRPAPTGYQGLGLGNAQGFRFNPDGTLWTTNGNNLYKFKGDIDGREYALQQIYDTTSGIQGQQINQLKWNNPEAFASSPQERYSIFANGNFEVTDNVKFFSRGVFAESKTRTLLFPANASTGWETSIPWNPATDSPVDPTLDYAAPGIAAQVLTDRQTNPNAWANPGFIPTGAAGAQHPVPVELAIALMSRRNVYCDPTPPPLGQPRTCGPAGTTPTANSALWGTENLAAGRLAPWVMETYPTNSAAARATTNTNTVWQVEGGLQFGMPFGDWTGEAYFSHGESSTYNVAYGNNSLTRQRALISALDYGRNAKISGNSTGVNPGFGAADITCQSGYYDTIFAGDVAPSDDCRFAVEATLQARTHNTQDIGELNFQGGLFDLPAGELRSAVGLQWRKNAAEFTPDILQSTASFTDQVIGVYPTAYLDAETSVKDVYAELLVPILSDLKWLKKFELELGGRYSDYEDTDSTTTYKVLGTAQVNNWIRFRGGYNRATRAPNLGELFLNRQEIFTVGGANFGDPCSLRSNAPYGAGGSAVDPQKLPTEPETQIAAGQTAAGAASTKLICEAQMGAIAPTFYSGDPIGGGGSPFNWVLQEGNPNLESEKADTWTLGFVFESQAESAWLSGLSVALDWWKVDIEDAIQQYSVDYARFLCYGSPVANATEAAARAASPECQSVSRNPGSGNANTILIAYDNQATIATSGIDIGVNWIAGLSDLGMGNLPGRVGLNIQASYLDYYKTKQSPAEFDVETDWKGSLGPNLSGTNAGAYSYRLNSTFSYTLPTVSFSMRWRHLPSVYPAATASQSAIVANNERVAATGEGTMLSYTPGTAIKAKSYNMIDLSFNWNLTDRFSLRGGVDNVFDWKPRIIGDNGQAANPTGQRSGYEAGTVTLADVCSAEAQTKGCVDPTNFLMPSTGAGFTNGGYYDILGRSYFLGFKARF